MNTDASLWPTVTNAVGRAVEVAPEARTALAHMLDVIEAHETDDLLRSAVAWCDQIAERGYVTAGPWTGFLGLVTAQLPPFKRLIPDVYPDQAALGAAKRERIRFEGGIPNLEADWPENLR